MRNAATPSDMCPSTMQISHQQCETIEVRDIDEEEGPDYDEEVRQGEEKEQGQDDEKEQERR